MCQKLETNHRIHLHCFTGTWSMAKKYLDSFPNLCIGITPLITFNSNYSLRELVMNIPLDRLLVETDAPYFVPKLENVIFKLKYFLYLNLNKFLFSFRVILNIRILALCLPLWSVWPSIEMCP